MFESVALYRFRGFKVGEGRRRGRGARVTPSFFHVLRATAARGRLFAESDGEVGHEHVAILTYGLAAAVGGVASHRHDAPPERRAYTVVGVLPQKFGFLNPDVRVNAAAFTPEERSRAAPESEPRFIGRLAPGVTLAQAQSQLDALNETYIERRAAERGAPQRGYAPESASSGRPVRNVRTALQLLWGGVLFVLLIAAVNITNLALARTSGRCKELATRHAIGAAQARVTRQLLTETGLLTWPARHSGWRSRGGA